MQPLKTHCTALFVAINFVMGSFAHNAAFAQETDIDALQAQYTLNYHDGSHLKEKPTEVHLVKAESMQKEVAGKVALGVLLFALAGGTGFTSSSKDNMNGAVIDGLEDRSNLQIPSPDAFAQRLQVQVNNAIKSSETAPAKPFSKPLLVAGGATNLVYESLTGEESQLYRLKSDWVVYKQRESFSFRGPYSLMVNCNDQSDKPLSQDEWAQDNYARVKSEMDATLARCEKKVLAAAPDLLKD